MLVLGPKVHASAGVHLLPAMVVLGDVGNFSEHGLHYFLLTEEIELVFEPKSTHNSKTKCELSPCGSQTMLIDITNVFQAVAIPCSASE